MFKKLKIFLLAFILSICTISYVYAVDINMNLSNTNNTNTANTSPNISSNVSTLDNNLYTSTDSYSVSLSSMPEAELGLENILNIILIVVGILLILLGIAIMIRLKK